MGNPSSNATSEPRPQGSGQRSPTITPPNPVTPRQALYPISLRPEGAATCQPRAERSGDSPTAPPWVSDHKLPALKGRQNKAQGKAKRRPGFRPTYKSSPERATQWQCPAETRLDNRRFCHEPDPTRQFAISAQRCRRATQQLSAEKIRI